MKELTNFWDHMRGRRYSAVDSNDRELRDLTNRIQAVDLANFESNGTECEVLNAKFDDVEFNTRKEAIINRLFERRRKGQVARHPKGKFYMFLLIFN